MHGLVVIEGMTLSGHPWIINEIIAKQKKLEISHASQVLTNDHQSLVLS